MPKKGWIDPTYPTKLITIGIRIMEPFHGAKKHHQLQCIKCNHEWLATPLSKLQNYRNHGMEGCPKCTDKERHKKNRKENLEKIISNGFEILTEGFDGKRHLDYSKTTPPKIKVKNIKCGHIFDCTPANLLSRNVNCPICNNQRKRKAFQQFNLDRQEEYQKTASAWNIFRHRVYQLTRQTYKEHHQTINPKNLMRGKAGVTGAYHLDHLVPVRYCFDNDIPSDLCAHHTNLQMLHWNDNIGSRDKLKQNIPIPEILQEFINT